MALKEEEHIYANLMMIKFLLLYAHEDVFYEFVGEMSMYILFIINIK